jgi:hypothetical protein
MPLPKGLRPPSHERKCRLCGLWRPAGNVTRFGVCRGGCGPAQAQTVAPGRRPPSPEVQLRASWRAAARRLGVSEDVYAAERQAGRRWCNYHKQFEAEGLFGRDRLSCKEGERLRTRELLVQGEWG